MTCKVEVEVNGERATAAKRRVWELIPARYGLLYGLLLLAIVGFMFVRATDDLKPREVATTLLGGQIGFLGFLFAVVTFVADTGVLSGSRGVRRLTVSALPYFALVLLATGATAVCVIIPSEVFLRIVVGVALTIATLLPIAIIHLSRKAAPEYVADEIRNRLAPIFGRRDFDKYADVIREDLNDLRASAILLWERGDLEGYKTLISAFLSSIPQEEKKDQGTLGSLTLTAERYPQFTFLRMWIEMQGEEPGGLLFMANQVEDEVIERLKNREYQVAAALLGFIVETVGYVLADTTHAEFKVHTFRLIEEVAHKAFHVAGPSPQQVVHQVHMLNEMVMDFLDPCAHSEGDPVVQQAYDALFALALLLRVWPCEMSDCNHALCKKDRNLGAAEVLMEMHSRSLSISGEIVERLAHDVFASTERVKDTSDHRVKTFGALVPSIDLLRSKGEDRRAIGLLDAVTAGLSVNAIDTGSARYVQKCLEVLQYQSPHGVVHNHVAFLRTQYIVDSRKTKDLREHVSLLMEIALRDGIDLDSVATGIENCVMAVLELRYWRANDWLDVLQRLVEEDSSRFSRRAAIRERIIGFLERVTTAQVAHNPSSIHADARLICHLVIALLQSEDRNGSKLRDPKLGDVATLVKERIASGKLNDETVIRRVGDLSVLLAPRLVTAAARVNALKFFDLAVLATADDLSLGPDDREDRLTELVGVAHAALELPRTVVRPSEAEIAIQAVETITGIVGGSSRDVTRSVVLAAIWVRRFGLRNVPADLSVAARLEICLKTCDVNSGDFGDKALLLAARRSVARLLNNKSDAEGNSVRDISNQMEEIRDRYEEESFGIGNRLGLLEAYGLVGRAEYEIMAYSYAALNCGHALLTACWHLRTHRTAYHAAPSADRREIISVIISLVRDISDYLERIDAATLLVSPEETRLPGVEPALDTKRIWPVDRALAGVGEFLRLFAFFATNTRGSEDELEWSQRVTLDFAREIGEVFVSVRSLKYAFGSEFGQESTDWKNELFQRVDTRFRNITSSISRISNHRSFDMLRVVRADFSDKPAQSSYVTTPLHVSATVAASIYEATIKTTTLGNAPLNRRKYLEDRERPSLNGYINDLLRGIKVAGEVGPEEERRIDDDSARRREVDEMTMFEKLAMIDALDLIAGTESGLAVAKSAPEPSKDDVLEHHRRVRRMHESAILVRELLQVDDGLVKCGIDFMAAVVELLRHEEKLESFLDKSNDPVVRGRAEQSRAIIRRSLRVDVDRVFGGGANSSLNEWSVFHRALAAEVAAGGLPAEEVLKFTTIARNLVSNILRDKERRDLSSDLRFRLRSVRSLAPEGTMMRRLCGELLLLWNPFYAEPTADEEWLLPTAAKVEWMRVQRPGLEP